MLLYILSFYQIFSPLTRSQASLESAWQKVLLNQFHDVLPGSGIGIIYPEAQTLYQEAIDAANTVRDNAASAIFGLSPSYFLP